MFGRAQVRALALIPIAALVGGLGIMAVASAGPALAACPPVTCTETGSTTASVTIGETATLTDGTPTISFTPPVSLPGTSTNSPTVSLTAATNDPAGWYDTITAVSTASDGHSFVGTAHPANSIPITDLTVTGGEGSSGPQPFGVNGQSQPDYENAATSGVTFLDTYSLVIPNMTADVYTTVLNYTITGQ
jgi:hypothetical protein